MSDTLKDEPKWQTNQKDMADLSRKTAGKTSCREMWARLAGHKKDELES